MSAIRNFYKGKNILITGATGFLGLGIIEKLLRSFPEVANIYMIVRPRHGQTLNQRKEVFLANQVFTRLKSENEANFSKLVWIEGDLNKANMGLSRNTISELQESINMIIHSAATISFVEPLKQAINLNVSATNDLINFATGCQNFHCFVHLSTLYCQARKSIKFLGEQIMPHPIDPKELINISNYFTRDELNSKTKEFILDWPNTYTYTKNAAENLLASNSKEFPIVIFRPGVVIPSYKEPTPYWLGKNMAFTRVMMESQRGLENDANPVVNANTVPVDLTINGMFMAAYQTASDKQFNIYNYSTNSNPYTYKKAFDNYSSAIENYHSVLIPLRKKLLAMDPQPGSKEEKMIQEIRFYQEFHETALYFLQNHFDCSNDNMDNLWDQMNDEEKQLLPFDVRGINWEEFFTKMYCNVYGTKKITMDLDNDNIDNLWDQMNDEEKQLLPFDVRGINWEEFFTKMYCNVYGTKKITMDLE